MKKKFRDYKNDCHWDEDKHIEALERREIKRLCANKEKYKETTDKIICEITNNAFYEYNKQAILEGEEQWKNN